MASVPMIKTLLLAIALVASIPALSQADCGTCDHKDDKKDDKKDGQKEELVVRVQP